MVLCPAHADKNPSLQITLKDERWLLRCHAGCEYPRIIEAAGLEERRLFFRDRDPSWVPAPSPPPKPVPAKPERVGLVICGLCGGPPLVSPQDPFERGFHSRCRPVRCACGELMTLGEKSNLDRLGDEHEDHRPHEMLHPASPDELSTIWERERSGLQGVQPEGEPVDGGEVTCCWCRSRDHIAECPVALGTKEECWNPVLEVPF